MGEKCCDGYECQGHTFLKTCSRPRVAEGSSAEQATDTGADN